MKVEGWFDGSCGPVNPGGIARFGYVIRQEPEFHLAHSGLIGSGPGMTNNVAEARAVQLLMDRIYLLVYGFANPHVVIYGDSSIVIRQLRSKRKRSPKGSWAAYMDLAHSSREKLEAIAKVEYCWIPREQNTEADALSKETEYE